MRILFDSDKPHLATWVGIHNIDPKVMGIDKLDHGERINPLYYSALCGFYDLSQHLIFKNPHDVNATGGGYDFPLLAALDEGHIKVAELLLDHGASVNARVNKGTTPLLIAVIIYHLKINAAQFLLEHHANVNVQVDNLLSPIHLAVFCHDTALAKVLLEHGADVNSQDSQGKTPLHLLIEENCFYKPESISRGVLEHTELLLKHGAEVNIQDKEHQTLLHLTTKWGQFGLTHMLLTHGADTNVPNSDGKTPLHLLLASGIQYYEDRVLNFVQLLLEHGVELNRPDENNETLLHLTMRRSWFVLAWFLLENGADASAENSNGETALHLLSESRVYEGYYVRGYPQLFVDPEYGVEVEQRDSHNGRWTCYEFVICS